MFGSHYREAVKGSAALSALSGLSQNSRFNPESTWDKRLIAKVAWEIADAFFEEYEKRRAKEDEERQKPSPTPMPSRGKRKS